MKRKRAIIRVELVDESIVEANEKIARELLEWFHEDAIAVPWVKHVKDVTVDCK
jgi:ABC-type iron transport system FetAB ATPase subunit